MNIAFRVKCKRCGEYWWAIIGENPCYDICSHCKTEHKISVEVKAERIIAWEEIKRNENSHNQS